MWISNYLFKIHIQTIKKLYIFIPNKLDKPLDISGLLEYNKASFKNVEVISAYFKIIGGVWMTLSIAAKVSVIIKEKGFKQCAIANKAGFSARELNDIICGRKVFRADYVIPICYALGITPNDLFGINSSDPKGE